MQSQRHAQTVQKNVSHEPQTPASKVHEFRDIPFLYLEFTTILLAAMAYWKSYSSCITSLYNSSKYYAILF